MWSGLIISFFRLDLLDDCLEGLFVLCPVSFFSLVGFKGLDGGLDL